MMTTLRNTAAMAAIALPLAALLAGCGSSGGGTPQGRARVINALTGTTTDVEVDANSTQVITTSAPFGQVSPNVGINVNAGPSVPVVAKLANTTSVIATANVPITQGADQLILTSGVYGQTGALAPMVSNVGVVDLSSPPVSAESRFYFINAAAGSSTANFTLSVNGQPFTTGNDLTRIAYAAMSTAELPSIPDSPSNTVSISATSTNTDNSSQNVAATQFTVNKKTTYAVVLTGQTTNAGGNPALAIDLIALD